MKFISIVTGAVKSAALLTVMCTIMSATSRDKINVYTDVNHKVVFFSVRGEDGKVYQLYMFDVDGRMVRQAETRNKQTTVIKGIDKGVYLFEVFSNDTRIGNGQIAVK